MGIYIEDDKKKTVRHYCTSAKVEKAIETLLRQDDELVWSETHEGYIIDFKQVSGRSCNDH